MNKRQKIIVSITGIFIVLLALVGLTYAYFLTQIRGNEETKSISVTTANLILEYGDGSGTLYLNNIMPGTTRVDKTFTVTNRGNETVENYNVYLENVQNQLELKDDLIYVLSCRQYKTEDYEIWENSTDENKKITDLTQDGYCSEASSGITTFPSVMSVIATESLDPGYTHHYTLGVKYDYKDYDQSVDMNKKISAKVNVYDGKTKFLSTEIINNTTLNKENGSTTGTLYTLPNELPTKIAEEINGENERVLSYTFDDLGTSYYYRGNVNDNYVNFAGMCWRIVRIEGDGSIKLILEDKNTTCDNENYTGDWSIGKGNYGYKLEEDYYKMSYLQPDIDGENTSMVKAFYDFQTNNMKNYVNKLKSGNWCLGDKAYIATEISDEIYQYTFIEDLNYQLYDFYYDSYVRLNGDNIEGYQPTLKCNGRILNNFETVKNETGEEIINATAMFVSGITADEMIYAGAKDSQNNQTLFLLNNYQKEEAEHFLSISPGKLNGSVDFSYYMRATGTVRSARINDNGFNFRPMISLLAASTTTIKTDTTTYGEAGTQTNPYVIN